MTHQDLKNLDLSSNTIREIIALHDKATTPLKIQIKALQNEVDALRHANKTLSVMQGMSLFKNWKQLNMKLPQALKYKKLKN